MNAHDKPMSAHDRLRLEAPIDQSFASRDRGVKENAWVRSLKPQTVEHVNLIHARKRQVRDARDKALSP